MGFRSVHPGVTAVYLAAVIACAVGFDQPVVVGIGLAGAYLFAAKLRGRRAAAANLLWLLAAAGFALCFAGYCHFGATVLLRNPIGNAITAESAVFGLVRGLQAVTVILWLQCLWELFSADKVVYLLGRLSPRLSLFVSCLLRMVPRLKSRWQTLARDASGIGRGPGQGTAVARIAHWGCRIGAAVSWLIQGIVQAADSMKCRGLELPGRTAFSLYRFDGRDRALVLSLSALGAVVLAAALLGQTSALYDPEIILGPVTAGSWLFYGAYGALCLAPTVLQTVLERLFDRRRRQRPMAAE